MTYRITITQPHARTVARADCLNNRRPRVGCSFIKVWLLQAVLAPLAMVAAGIPLSVNHFAGSAGGQGRTDGNGTNARFYAPSSVAIDTAGNVYVADTGNNTIRKIAPSGTVTTLAGAAGQVGSDDGTGATARFKAPSGVAVDGSGNVYVADTGNHTIRKITPAGVVTTVAGTASVPGSSSDGIGAAARLDSPSGVAVDGSGNIYVADKLSDTIRHITPSGVVTTLAGSPYNYGNGFDINGTGAAAQFNHPSGVAVDSSGNVYVADTNSCTIRKITPSGVVTTLLGGITGLSSTSDGGWRPEGDFYYPLGVAVDRSGNVYVADSNNDTIRKATPSGVLTTLAGTAVQAGSSDGTGASAQFSLPSGVAVDSSGNVFVADTKNNTIRKITPAANVSTFAGMANLSGSADGTGTAAQFFFPDGVAVDNSGNVYVADSLNNTIRKITPSGVVTTLAGTASVAGGNSDGTGAAAQFNGPTGITVDNSGNVFVAESYSNTIRKITPSGVVTTLAGTAGLSGSVNGTGSVARFSSPIGIAADRSGNLYVTDSGNNTIRKITSAGAVTTFAGTASVTGGSADGTGAAAQFNGPTGIAVDSSGNVFVVDSGSHTIRKITPSRVVTTLAGTVGISGSTDGPLAAAQFNNPGGVAVDSLGNVYVADCFNHTIRQLILSEGRVTTIAGTIGQAGCSDGTGIGAQFNYPDGLAVDSSGNIYVADTYNNAIRKGIQAPTSPTISTQPASLNPTLGMPASLLVAVIGSDPLSYQWQKSPHGANTWSNIAGATAATLSFASVQSSDSADYKVTVTNSYGSITSTIAFVNVQAGQAPQFTAQPQAASGFYGDTITFSASAYSPQGSTDPVSYQWYKGSTPITGNASATTATLTLTNVQATDATYSYYVKASNLSGSNPSSPVSLTLGTKTAPTITTQPSNLNVTGNASGQQFTFTVAATSVAPLSYQWQVSTNLGGAWSNLSDGDGYSGSTSPTLTLDGNYISRTWNGYEYRCVVTADAANPSNSVSTTSSTPILYANIIPVTPHWSASTLRRQR